MEAELVSLQREETNKIRHKHNLEDLRIQKAQVYTPSEVSRTLVERGRQKFNFFFHLSTTILRRRNKIDAICENGNWIYKEEEIANYFINNFQTLFISDQPQFS